jgi:spermidine synthase
MWGGHSRRGSSAEPRITLTRHPFTVKRLERLDEATAPDGSVLTLLRHDRDYAIHVRGVELMSTRRHHSEEELAARACARLQGAEAPTVLIGGLGFGYTLRTALELLPADARVTVAEIVPAIVAWNRDPGYPFASAELADARVELLEMDVAEVLRARQGAFDAIVLDVDNGAEALTTGGNAALYTKRGVRIASAALRRGGRLAYWSADANPRFAELLRSTGLAVEAVRARAHVSSGAWHTLFIAHREGEA